MVHLQIADCGITAPTARLGTKVPVTIGALSEERHVEPPRSSASASSSWA
jgi:hypothetical protein